MRAAIERQTGPVRAAEIPSAGRNSDFSATLHLVEGAPVFCKGIADAEGKRGAMHRHEAEINPQLSSAWAPKLRWRTETDGWLLLGFDHVAGRHADLAPGSADLLLVTNTVAMLGRDLTNCSHNAPRLAEQWARLAPWRRLAENRTVLDQWTARNLDRLMSWEACAVDAADGDNLVHTDLHPLNMLVSGDRVVIVDWAWSRKSSAAVDIAFLIARLVAAGHSPAKADRWAEELPIWQRTSPDIRLALAVEIWGIWEYLREVQPRPLWNQLTPAARSIARFYLGETPNGGESPLAVTCR
ncbi:phosphotransferase family protein [Amycolatopsis oliviviridis]|uniref:phosphotransferase family protein n=1 Tax=Amycolatopsis oliviviridis TaxID=1471590 RepID=UPI001E494C55|nr:phosphotransferase [Amycolatopsis oliviviridis]